MSSVGQFNLRTRKSLKLIGQIECNSCKRHYFPSEYSDSDSEGVNDIQINNICCNCTEKKRCEPTPKRRAVQRKSGSKDVNDVQTDNIGCNWNEKLHFESTPRKPTVQRKSGIMATTIKQEKMESDDMDANAHAQPNVYHNQQNWQSGKPIEKENVQKRGFKVNTGRMVQIHSTELLTPQPFVFQSNVSRQAAIKKEKVDIELTEATNCQQVNRALKNRTNTIQPTDEQDQTNANESTAHVKEELVITKADTVDSLRRKFPKATGFEFEFLLFLKEKTTSN